MSLDRERWRWSYSFCEVVETDGKAGEPKKVADCEGFVASPKSSRRGITEVETEYHSGATWPSAYSAFLVPLLSRPIWTLS
jgi:hypothetical protein